MLKWGEALHDYDVSLAEGAYTVVVNVMKDDPTQVMVAVMRAGDDGAAAAAAAADDDDDDDYE